MFIDVADEYALGGATSVNVEVVVGNKQHGHIAVLVDDKPAFDGSGRASGTVPVREGTQLIVTAAVNDTNTLTNHTSVTVTVAGGASKRTFTAQYEVERTGQSVDYTFVLDLIP